MTADTQHLDRKHWQAAARVALADLDTRAMSAEHYRLFTVVLSTLPRKRDRKPHLTLVRSEGSAQ